MTATLLQPYRAEHLTGGGGRIVSLKQKVQGIMYNQGIWRGVVWGLGSMLLIDGVFYAIMGNSIAYGPSFYVLEQIPYGGLHLLGAVQIVLGVLLILVRNRNVRTRRLLLAVFGFGMLVICFTIAGWIVQHKLGISAFSKWFFLSWVSLWLANTTLGRRVGVLYDVDEVSG